MAVEVASLKAVLSLDKKDFDGGIKNASSSLSGFGGSIKGVVGAIGAIGAGIAVFSGVTSAIGEMVNSAREAVATGKQLEQTIKATGGVAGVTVQAAKDLAGSLSNLTNFEDDAILSGENLLLTFTNIGKDIFPKATETMLDMSQVMGQDLKSSAIQLGKALNDPLKGMGALSRIGVSFTEEQKQLVKEMMAVNDIAGAQGVILDAIATQGFGGQAKALADPFIMLQNAIGEIGEAIGMSLLPLLNELAQAVLPGLRAAAEVLGPVLLQLGQMQLGALKPILDILGTAFGDLITSFSSLNAGVSALSVALGMGTQKINIFKVLLLPLMIPLGLLAGVLEVLSVAIAIVGHTFEAVAFVLTRIQTGFERLTSTGGQLSTLGTTLTNTWKTFTTALSTLWAWIVKVTTAWTQMLVTMGQQPAHPDITPGSPTPLEMGLKGINRQLSIIGPQMSGFMGNIPTSYGASGNSGNTTNVHLGGQQFSFSGPNSEGDAVRAVVQLLTRQLATKS